MEARRHTKPSMTPDGQGVRLIFELTNLCNFSCTHCIRDEEGEKLYLPVALVEKVLAEVQPYLLSDVARVVFVNGLTVVPDSLRSLMLVTSTSKRSISSAAASVRTMDA